MSDEATPEFRYFVERILPAISPSRNRFKDRKGKTKLSEIFTISDEAFGLVMLLNEFHCWEEAAEKLPGERYAKKKFCDARSGNKIGWSEKGTKVYNRICKNLRSRRNKDESVRLENNMYKEYSRENGRNRELSSDESVSDAESIFEDDTCLDGNDRIAKSEGITNP